MRASLKANLAFGTILVPVEFYKATEDIKVRFNRIHIADQGKVKQRLLCEKCNQELTSADITKGYDAGGIMLPFTDAEIDALRPTGSNIEIDRFCHLNEIPLIAYGGDTYFAGTGKKGLGRPFHMLRKAMLKANIVCVIKWVSRGTSHIAVMVPDYKGFIVKTLHYIDEIRANEAEILQADVTDETVDKAIALITAKMMKPFAIEDFPETYNSALRELIERRAAGETIVVEEIKPVAQTDNVDAALDAMLG